MRSLFSFVLLGALGLTAAVGASSFSTITFTGIKEPKGPALDGFDLNSQNAEITLRSGGGEAVLLTPDTAPFYDVEAPQLAAASPLDAVLTVTGGEPFEFVSVYLGEPEQDLGLPISKQLLQPTRLDVTGFRDGGVSPIIGSLIGFTGGGTFSASSFNEDFEGSQLTGLQFTVPASADADDEGVETFLAIDTEEQLKPLTQGAETPVIIDDIIVLLAEAPAPVPGPTSAALLATAMVGGGIWARRKRKKTN